jgi:hypothetical protein
MTAAVLIVGIICIGLYFLLRSYYPTLTFGKYLGYFIVILLFAWLVKTFGHALGNRLGGEGWMRRTQIRIEPLVRAPRNIEFNNDNLQLHINDARVMLDQLNPELRDRLTDVVANAIDRRLEEGGNFQVIDLVDDLDPQLQQALVDAVRDIQNPQPLTVEEIVAKYEEIPTPQPSECGVCYVEMEEGELLGCPECHKAAHKECLENWLKSGQRLCIYCRYAFTAND